MEPVAEFGVQYLSITRELAARHKGLALPERDLELPIRLYRARKTLTDPGAQAAFAEADTAMQSGDYTRAAEILAGVQERAYTEN